MRNPTPLDALAAYDELRPQRGRKSGGWGKLLAFGTLGALALVALGKGDDQPQPAQHRYALPVRGGSGTPMLAAPAALPAATPTPAQPTGYTNSAYPWLMNNGWSKANGWFQPDPNAPALTAANNYSGKPIIPPDTSVRTRAPIPLESPMWRYTGPVQTSHPAYFDAEAERRMGAQQAGYLSAGDQAFQQIAKDIWGRGAF